MTISFTFLHDVLVPHKAFQTGLNRIEYFLRSAPMEEPEILAVLGQARSGKTRLIKTISSAHPSWRDENGRIVPVVRVSVPSKPTIKGLGDLILKELDPEDSRRYTENELTRRIQVLMRECGTKLLMLDEFQHFFDRTSKKVWHYVTDWLKVLIDAVGCVLVVTGLPDCTAVIKQCPQFRGRCRQKILLPQFQWMRDDDQAEFRGIVASFWIAMTEMGIRIPDLRHDVWAYRMYCASGGLTGYVKRLLSEVVIEAELHGHKRELGLNDFAEAYKRFMITFEDLPSASFNPFLHDAFKVEWTDEIAEHVKWIGKAISVEN